MSRLHSFEAGGYSFLEGGFPYSQGVIADPGFAIRRVRFLRPLPVARGFEAIANHLTANSRPLTALCAAELRSPMPFTFEGFHEFNNGYVEVLRAWGLTLQGLNPVARSNVCPLAAPPSEPVFYAFSYTVPATDATAAADFVVAGSGEWPEGSPFPERIVARGDVSPAGLGRKAAFVIQMMHNRVDELRVEWGRLTGVQVYTVHDFHPLLASHFDDEGLTPIGLTWQVCNPPIRELEFEMDVRSVGTELVIG